MCNNARPSVCFISLTCVINQINTPLHVWKVFWRVKIFPEIWVLITPSIMLIYMHENPIAKYLNLIGGLEVYFESHLARAQIILAGIRVLLHCVIFLLQTMHTCTAVPLHACFTHIQYEQQQKDLLIWTWIAVVERSQPTFKNLKNCIHNYLTTWRFVLKHPSL